MAKIYEIRGLYAIWCFDLKQNKGDWMRELPSSVEYGGDAILVYETKQSACNRAAESYGFDAYTEAKRKGWCEVRRIA